MQLLPEPPSPELTDEIPTKVSNQAPLAATAEVSNDVRVTVAPKASNQMPVAAASSPRMRVKSGTIWLLYAIAAVAIASVVWGVLSPPTSVRELVGSMVEASRAK